MVLNIGLELWNVALSGKDGKQTRMNSLEVTELFYIREYAILANLLLYFRFVSWKGSLRRRGSRRKGGNDDNLKTWTKKVIKTSRKKENFLFI